MNKHVAVILSGCGVFDGSEIHEATATLISLDSRGVSYQCFAPDISFEAIDHTTHKPSGETRSTLVEAARIARGEIQPLSELNLANFDAIVFPGGFGAASNLCSYATDGTEHTVHSEVANLITTGHQQKIPMGFICIAPVLAGKVLAGNRIKLPHCDSEDLRQHLNTWGQEAVDCAADDIVSDVAHRIISTPAYMMASGPATVARGVDKLIQALIDDWKN